MAGGGTAAVFVEGGTFDADGVPGAVGVLGAYACARLAAS